MRRSLSILAALLLSALLLPGCAREYRPGKVPGETGAELMVFAAASLTEALPQAAAAYQAEHPKLRINFNFAGSQQLRRQVEQGAGADLIVTADWQHMRALAEEGLVVAPAALLRNELVVIVPRDNPAGIRDLADLAERGRLVLADPAVPVGRYSRQVLAHLAAVYGPDYPRRVEERVVSLEGNVKQVATKVALGEADAGIVYRTDVTPALRERVTVLPVPEKYNVTAEYPAALLAEARGNQRAREFLDFLHGDAARAVFQRYGFQPAWQPGP